MMHSANSSPAEGKPSRENLFIPLVAGEDACQVMTVCRSAGENDVIHCAMGPAVRFGTCVSPCNPEFYNIMNPPMPNPTTGKHRYKIFEVEAATHLPGGVRILNDSRTIGETLADEISAAGGAKAFGVECPTFGWFLAGGYYRVLLHETDAHFNTDLAMKELSNLPGRAPIDFFAPLKGRMSQISGFLVPALEAQGMTRAAMGPGIPHEGMGGTLMQSKNSGDKPAFAAPPLPCLDGADPVSAPGLLDTWFKQIQDILRELKHRHGPVSVAFMGGGTVPIPDWFRDWCAQEGIIILIIDPPSAQMAPP